MEGDSPQSVPLPDGHSDCSLRCLLAEEKMNLRQKLEFKQHMNIPESGQFITDK